MPKALTPAEAMNIVGLTDIGTARRGPKDEDGRLVAATRGSTGDGLRT